MDKAFRLLSTIENWMFVRNVRNCSEMTELGKAIVIKPVF